MTMRIFAYLAAAGALLLNPAACRSPDYAFTRKQINAALEGTWTVTVNGKASSFRIDLGHATATHAARASLVAPASACSHQTLISSAEACMDVTDVKLALIPVEGELPTKATFSIYGLSFNGGRMQIQLADAEIEASVTAAGIVQDTYAVEPSYHQLTAQLVHSRESQ